MSEYKRSSKTSTIYTSGIKVHLSQPVAVHTAMVCLSKAVLDVVVDRVRVGELVLGGVETAHALNGGANERVSTSLVGRSLPEHAATEAETLEVGDLLTDHVRGVEGDERLGGGIVGVGGAGLLVVLNSGAILGENLVVPDAVLPAALTDTGERLAEAISASESATVDGHTEDDLLSGDATGNVSLDGLLGVEGGGGRVRLAGVEVSLVAGVVTEATGVVVGHEVDVVEDVAEIGELEEAVVLGTSGSSNGELEVVAIGVSGGVSVKLLADTLEKEDHVGGLLVGSRVLPVNVDTIESPILHEADGGLGEGRAGGISGSSSREVGRPSPATNGKHNLEVAVGLLELVNLLNAAIGVVASVTPAFGPLSAGLVRKVPRKEHSLSSG